MNEANMAKYIYTDGRETKAIDPWHSDGEMWKYNSNPPASEITELYSRVAAVYRALNFTADALSNMPFAITSTGGDEIDDQVVRSAGIQASEGKIKSIATVAAPAITSTSAR